MGHRPLRCLRIGRTCAAGTRRCRCSNTDQASISGCLGSATPTAAHRLAHRPSACAADGCGAPRAGASCAADRSSGCAAGCSGGGRANNCSVAHRQTWRGVASVVGHGGSGGMVGIPPACRSAGAAGRFGCVCCRPRGDCSTRSHRRCTPGPSGACRSRGLRRWLPERLRWWGTTVD